MWDDETLFTHLIWHTIIFTVDQNLNIKYMYECVHASQVIGKRVLSTGVLFMGRICMLSLQETK